MFTELKKAVKDVLVALMNLLAIKVFARVVRVAAMKKIINKTVILFIILNIKTVVLLYCHNLCRQYKNPLW